MARHGCFGGCLPPRRCTLQAFFTSACPAVSPRLARLWSRSRRAGLFVCVLSSPRRLPQVAFGRAEVAKRKEMVRGGAGASSELVWMSTVSSASRTARRQRTASEDPEGNGMYRLAETGPLHAAMRLCKLSSLLRSNSCACASWSCVLRQLSRIECRFTGNFQQ